MPDKAALLQNLRGLHDPAPITWWPLAPGWYGLIVIILLLVIAVGYGLYRHWRNTRQRRAALQQLAELQRQWREQTLDAAALMTALSILLKRTALSRFPRQRVAGLQGAAWLAFLDETGHTHDFSLGVGQMLCNAPYQPVSPAIPEALFTLIKRWIGESHAVPK